MTVTATNASSGPYTGNGSTTAFPFTFSAASAAEVAVTLDGSTASASLYTVSLTEGGGGTVTFATAPASGVTILISSDPEFTQETSFENNGAFLPGVFDQIHDRAAIRDLYLLDQVGRSPRVAAGQAGLVIPSSSHNEVLGTSNGDLVLLDQSDFLGDEGAVMRAASFAREAEASALLAEAAALTAPKVYASTAAGLAAVSEGGTFWVEGTGGSIDLYRKAGGVAVLLDPFRIEEMMDAIGGLPNLSNVNGLNGNVGNADHAMRLRKVGRVVERNVGVPHMAGLVEGPMVWWDEVDLLYHMVFTCYSSTNLATTVASIGHATSLDAVFWDVVASPLFQASGTPGSPDFAGTTGAYMVKKGGTYYLFYIGLTAVGYEGGIATICLATASSLAGPWTRHGTVIGRGTAGTASAWRSTAVFHPSIVQRAGTYYLFFNASGTFGGVGGKERIGYATSTDLLTWTVDDANSPLINVGGWATDIVGDPSVYRSGDGWFMDFFGLSGASAGDGLAFTTDADFPLGWRQHPNNPLLARSQYGFDDHFAHKPFIYFKGGRKFHYYTAVDDGGVRSIALAVGDDYARRRTYATDTDPLHEVYVPETKYAVLARFGSPGGPTFDIVYDAAGNLLKLERTAENGFVAKTLLTFGATGGGGGFTYDSGWTPIVVNTAYTFTHGVGGYPTDVLIQFGDSAGAIAYEGWGFFNASWRFVATDSAQTYVDATIVSVMTGGSLKGSDGGAKGAATHMRVLAK